MCQMIYFGQHAILNVFWLAKQRHHADPKSGEVDEKPAASIWFEIWRVVDPGQKISIF